MFMCMFQVVALPYNTLLHRQTREACGIRLAGHVVIVDEAHNLADTISSVHSRAITGQQVRATLNLSITYTEMVHLLPHSYRLSGP